VLKSVSKAISLSDCFVIMVIEIKFGVQI
jgi:hypothetical protein